MEGYLEMSCCLLETNGKEEKKAFQSKALGRSATIAATQQA